MNPEITEQGRAFSMMQGEILDLINKYAVEFREIIESFKRKNGRPPTGEEILWIASQHAGRDLTK